MAVAGRAPMLPVDYSFFEPELGFSRGAVPTRLNEWACSESQIPLRLRPDSILSQVPVPTS